MEAKKSESQQKIFEASKQFQQLFKLGVYKQLHTDGIITEKQYKSILQKHKMC
ncbi:hypothetical protein [Aminipila sp.]|uniref:hypothetical protein n=1 Tax=Aminipila sp. TaxID=2060095 RepID=UPI002897A3C2|nr:hypothetical protein [Aminipila sp.]